MPRPERPAPAPRAARAAPADLALLLETVEDEARREREEVLAQARARAEERLREGERTAREVEARAEAAGTREGEREAHRRVALARIETRQALLWQREIPVERALGLARDRFATWLEQPEGRRWLARGIRAAARALGAERVRVCVDPGARDALAAALGADAASITWEPSDPGAGVLVRTPDGRRAVDLTVAGILRRREGAARRAAAVALFDAEAPA
jgi:vacuolar-type H+-ATPase subunit E/Vma4